MRARVWSAGVPAGGGCDAPLAQGQCTPGLHRHANCPRLIAPRRSSHAHGPPHTAAHSRHGADQVVGRNLCTQLRQGRLACAGGKGVAQEAEWHQAQHGMAGMAGSAHQPLPPPPTLQQRTSAQGAPLMCCCTPHRTCPQVSLHHLFAWCRVINAMPAICCSLTQVAVQEGGLVGQRRIQLRLSLLLGGRGGGGAKLVSGRWQGLPPAAPPAPLVRSRQHNTAPPKPRLPCLEVRLRLVSHSAGRLPLPRRLEQSKLGAVLVHRGLVVHAVAHLVLQATQGGRMPGQLSTASMPAGRRQRACDAPDAGR